MCYLSLSIFSWFMIFPNSIPDSIGFDHPGMTKLLSFQPTIFQCFPNWLARDKAIDKVLKILALTQDTGPTGRMAPTKMTFNIISNSPVKVEQKVDKQKIEKPKEKSEGV